MLLLPPAAAVALRWIVQQGSPLVTATNNTDYMAEDLGVVDGFELTEPEMVRLSSIKGKPPS